MKCVNLKTAVLYLGMLIMASVSHAESSWSLDQLMQSLAGNRSSHASFTEIKSIAILDKPVESSGELFYTAPDRLEKRTLTPKPESMALEKDRLIVEQRGKQRILSLRSYPEIAAFIDSIRATLAGDRKSLERTYQLTMEGSEQDWHLNLVPLRAKMQKVVSSIKISGSGNSLTTIKIEQADGDSSLMTITPLPAP